MYGSFDYYEYDVVKQLLNVKNSIVVTEESRVFKLTLKCYVSNWGIAIYSQKWECNLTIFIIGFEWWSIL